MIGISHTMFLFDVDCVAGSISAENEATLFSKNDLPAWRQWECTSYGCFFMTPAFSSIMDDAFSNFP